MYKDEQGNVTISNGFVVTPDGVSRGTVIVKNGRIADILRDNDLECTGTETYGGGEVVDAEGLYVMPGLVDLHCDALEQTVQPRKGVFFPVGLAISAVQAQLLSAGITTIYHAVSLSGEPGIRSNDTAFKIISEIDSFRKNGHSRMRHKIHARYESYNCSGLETIEKIFREGLADLFSIMDHSVKYGEARTLSELKRYIEKNSMLAGKDLDDYITELWDGVYHKKPAIEEKLTELVSEYKVAFATHDDDTPAKINAFRSKGSSISEFPLNIETARHAVENDMFSVVGAPNIIRDRSHTGNLSARPAIKEGYANIICSDYYSSALLASVFLLYDEGMSLDKAVSFASAIPAKASGMKEADGVLSKGGTADIILVSHEQGEFPAVKRTMVGGKWVYTV